MTHPSGAAPTPAPVAWTPDLNNLALWEALEEMRWPELPGIPFGVELVDPKTMETREVILRPEQVKGIFTALRKHAATLMPHAVQVSRDSQEVGAMRNKVMLLEKRVAELEAQQPVELVDTPKFKALRRLREVEDALKDCRIELKGIHSEVLKHG